MYVYGILVIEFILSMDCESHVYNMHVCLLLGEDCLLSGDSTGTFEVLDDNKPGNGFTQCVHRIFVMCFSNITLYVYAGEFRVLHQSPSVVLPTLRDVIPLHCIVSGHSLDDKYAWYRGQVSFKENTPILWVNIPGTHSCTISRNGVACHSKTITVRLGSMPNQGTKRCG